ncbi:SRPBCC family protein [Nocardioides ferulae]|uniref:SRPBCC family protein n=1 Tax=Nocardioides ferulae TaxID=2340821 RepID=UPI000EB5B0F4|nr:SRPBCC family protein [Nocardioides ferulae]
MLSTYVFRDTWTVAAPPDQVRDLVVDLERYPRWWREVVAVASLGPDHARVLCRSRLPYTLDLVLHAVSRDLPTLEVEVGGDLRGTVSWTLTSEGGGTRMDFAQEVEVRGPLAAASYLARPLLAWNHHRMMAGCADGLRRELATAPR